MANTLEGERPADYLTRLAASDLGRSYKSLVLNELGVQPGAVVVDLGCGPGADLAALADAAGSTGTGSPQTLIAQWSDSQAHRGECARSSAVCERGGLSSGRGWAGRVHGCSAAASAQPSWLRSVWMRSRVAMWRSTSRSHPRLVASSMSCCSTARRACIMRVRPRSHLLEVPHHQRRRAPTVLRPGCAGSGRARVRS